ncbi:MAG: J domain-containing protein [Acidimicrobiales bacterium]
MATLYDTLGVEPGASAADIKRAYRRLARTLHPDAGGDPAAMRAVNEAWIVLSDPARRRAYDGELLRTPPVADQPPWDDAGRPSLADLLDDRPLARPPFTSAISVAPATLFVASVAAAGFGVVLAQTAMLAFAGFLFFLSCIAVAAVALLSFRRR